MPLRSGKTTFELAGREFPQVTWYKDPALRKLYICLMFVVLTSATNGYDGSLLNALQTLKIWESWFFPGGVNSYLLGLLNCIMAVGSIVAIPFVPYTADLLGRRMGVVIGCSIMLFAVVLQTIGSNIEMFIAGRFFLGFGVAIAHGSSPLLIAETAHPQHRAILTTIYNTTWYLGSIVAAWLTFGTQYIPNHWCWRVPSLVQAFPSILQLIFVWTVPESPRWLIAKGRVDQAHGVLAKYHANGNLEDEVVVLELQEIRDTLKMEQEYESTGWPELWRTKGNRHRLIILISAGFFSQWSGNGIASYYLYKVLKGVGITDGYTQNLINGILQIVNLIWAVAMCFLVDKAGRRKLFLISTAGMLVAFIIETIAASLANDHGNSDAGKVVVAFIFLFFIAYNTAWSGLLVGYSVEILPYNIRAKGLTVMFLAVDLALWFNQFINPVAMDSIGWKYYIVYCCWLAFELAVVYFFYIETRNTPLEEIAKYFDGDDAVVGGAAATEKGRVLADNLGLEGTPHVISSDNKSAAVEQKEVVV